MGNGEWEMGKWGNGEMGKWGNGEMGNGEWEIVVSGNVSQNKLEFAPYGKETRTGCGK